MFDKTKYLINAKYNNSNDYDEKCLNIELYADDDFLSEQNFRNV